MISVNSHVMASLLPAALLLVQAQAQVIIDPAEITATAGSLHSPPFAAANLLDGETVEGFTDVGDPGPPERPPGHQNNHWLAAEGIFTETVTFDLGRAYHLTSIEILNTSNSNWNDSETDTFTVATSTDNGATYSDPGDAIILQDHTLGFQEILLDAADVTHVLLVVTNDSALGTEGGTDVRVGLNEVKFYQNPGPDSDGDGLPDSWEITHFDDLSRDGSEDEDSPAPDGLTNKQEFDEGTDPKKADSDDDGLTDGDEVLIHLTDPLDDDSDNDGLSDGDEINIHKSNPLSTDSDGDGLSDGDEVNIHLTNPADADTDGDGIDDFREVTETMTDPLVANSDPRGTLIDPTGITATADSTYNDSGTFDAENTLDGAFDEGNRDTHRGTHWISADGVFTETVTYDLGGSYSLSNISLLNTSNSNWNDSETDRLTFATSNDNGATFGATSPEIELQDFKLGFQTIPVDAAGVTHFQITVTNDGTVDGDPAPAGEARVGLNEIRFFSGNLTPLGFTAIRRYVEGAQTVTELTFNSTPGATYAIDFSSDLITWPEVNDSVTSQGDITVFTDRDPGIQGQPKIFYRVRNVTGR